MLSRRDLRFLHLAAGEADDAPDEQVEEDEEGDLEGEEDLFDLDGAGTDHGSWKTSSVEPRRIMSPSSSRARRTLRPLTSTPFVDSRSTT